MADEIKKIISWWERELTGQERAIHHKGWKLTISEIESRRKQKERM